MNISEYDSQRTLSNVIYIYDFNDEIVSLKTLIKEFNTLLKNIKKTINFFEKN